MALALICPVCGTDYDTMRTGLTFRAVRQMLWSPSEDPRHWRHVTRHTVLGLWHEIKLAQWGDHLEGCEHEISTTDAVETR